MTSLVWLVFACVVYQIAFLIWCRYALGKIGIVQPQKDGPPISVVISARNEGNNLEKHLSKVLSQDYRAFEVIVVNDRSTDNTQKVLDKLSLQHPHLQIVDSQLEGTVWNKKAALTIGIKEAKYEHIVCTDADCYPTTSAWLRYFSAHFEKGADMVLGVGFFEPSGSLQNRLYRLETAKVALLYLASASAGRPYMAVGRSFAYTKSLFNKQDGFKSHAHVQSGDDDLFMLQARSVAEIGMAPEAMVLSKAPENFGSWLKQKLRHQKTGFAYPVWALAYLGLYEVTVLLMVAGLGIVLMSENGIVISLYSLLLVIRFFLFRLSLAWLDERSHTSNRHSQLFLGEFLLAILNPVFSIATVATNLGQWRKRI